MKTTKEGLSNKDGVLWGQCPRIALAVVWEDREEMAQFRGVWKKGCLLAMQEQFVLPPLANLVTLFKATRISP
jgi:hypothetical protein